MFAFLLLNKDGLKSTLLRSRIPFRFQRQKKGIDRGEGGLNRPLSAVQ